MLGLGKNPLGRARLHHCAVVHYHNAGTHAADDSQVMGDEDQRDAASLGHALDDAQYAILRGGIQRGGRFIADEQIGVAGHGHGNEHALALASGELMRKSGGNVGIKLHLFESGCGIAHPGVGQLLAHAHKRI